MSGRPMKASELLLRRRMMRMTQQELGQAVSRTRWSVVQYETGKATIPDDIADAVDRLFSVRMGAVIEGGRVYSWQGAASVIGIDLPDMRAAIISDPSIATIGPGEMPIADRLDLVEGHASSVFFTEDQLFAFSEGKTS